MLSDSHLKSIENEIHARKFATYIMESRAGGNRSLKIFFILLFYSIALLDENPKDIRIYAAIHRGFSLWPQSLAAHRFVHTVSLQTPIPPLP